MRCHFAATDTSPQAIGTAMDNGRPTLINAVIDPYRWRRKRHVGSLNQTSTLKNKTESAI